MIDKPRHSKLLFFSIIFLILGAGFFPSFSEWVIKKVYAGSFTSASLTISDSRAGKTDVQYDFGFTTTVTTAIKDLKIQFCTTASNNCITPTGIDTTGATRSSDNIEGSGRSDDFTSNGTLLTTITTTAAQSTQAVTVTYTGIKNQTTADTTFFARITTYSDNSVTVIDSSSVGAATLTSTSIAVTASVDPTLTFTVSTAAGTVNGAPVNITAGTGPALIPFGNLTTGYSAVVAHNLSVTTNAVSGYTVTVKSEADPPLVDGSNNIDRFNQPNSAPTTWSAPAGSSANVNTGFFGYTTEDTTLGTGSANRFSSNKWAGPTTSPLEIMYSSAATSGSGDTVKVGWMAQVNALQPFGSYTGTIILVATPLY